MATTVKLTQTTSVPPAGTAHEGEYQSTSTFTEATSDIGGVGNWDNSFFLIKIEESSDPSKDTYQHVCTVGDLENFETDRAAAVAANDNYYRTPSATVYKESLAELDELLTAQQNRTQDLVIDWDKYQGGALPITTVNVFTA